MRKLFWPIISLYHWCWAFGSAAWYVFPSNLLIVIGITGTKGKTTVAELVAEILRVAGNKVAVSSGLGFRIGEEFEPSKTKMTMPGHGAIQKFLRKALDQNCKYAVVEVTSEGARQHRHRFINFSVAALTNLRPEHIESHGSYEAYRAAKGEFFRSAKKADHVVNLEEKDSGYFLKFPGKKKIGYGLKAESCQRYGNSIDTCLIPDEFHAEGSISFMLGEQVFETQLHGQFNLYNILCAIGIVQALGISSNTISDALKNFLGVPGRMEEIPNDHGLKVIVDYAHTPDSLEAVYNTLKRELERGTNGRLICVLGAAGGGRDKWKRPVMGGVAAKYCDKIFLTNEDPYDEDPNKIIEEIKKGISLEKLRVTEIFTDRKAAIENAVAFAKPGDTVIITGKGTEKLMAIGKDRTIDWDDRKTAAEAIDLLGNKR